MFAIAQGIVNKASLTLVQNIPTRVIRTPVVNICCLRAEVKGFFEHYLKSFRVPKSRYTNTFDRDVQFLSHFLSSEKQIALKS